MVSKPEDWIISVERLGKRYRLGKQAKSDSLVGAVRNALLYPLRNFRELTARKTFDDEDDPTVLWALEDVSFEVKRGEVLGIVGHNGAGKSSLLKILSRITPPTTGRATIRGRVSSLLEVGTGFHSELTGRDNVYMNGTVLGMTKAEIDGKFDEIVAFSGVEKHLDTPIKFYSSGMKVRLAFSVAAHLDPEILIIDEVLAVGDLAFQQKCLGKMDQVAKSGRTVLFVSHNMVSVEGLCTRCLLMEHGRIVFDGPVGQCIGLYREKNMADSDASRLATRKDRQGEQRVRFTGIEFNNGNPVRTCRPLSIDLTLEAALALDGLHITIQFSRSYREVIMSLDSRHHGQLLDVSAGENRIRVELPDLRLIPGEYLVDLRVKGTMVCEDYIFNAARISVGERDVYGSGHIPKANEHGFFVPPECSWGSVPAVVKP